MTVIAVDDTDSRDRGMCTTYVATRLTEQVRERGGTVERTLLVRLDPAVEHKTRGNAAVAVHCDLSADESLDLARGELDLAETDDPRTNPGVVVADCSPDAVPDSVVDVARRAVREYVPLGTVRDVLTEAGLATAERGTGRGLVGATAAVGAWAAWPDVERESTAKERTGSGTAREQRGANVESTAKERTGSGTTREPYWTYECISYRERDRWGTPREVDRDTVLAAAEAAYPAVWDTVDREEDTAVCVPRTPCPVLHGVRGDDPDAVRETAERIEGEPVAGRQLFVTNQGTDAHLRSATISEVEDDRAYRVTGTVASEPETREGGHVFFSLEGDGSVLRCAAFEPTKRFRDRVRALRPGDRVTACGEVGDGTLKLEKFAVRDLVRTERVTPDCPDCGRSMGSAGADAGYRCRDCGTAAAGKVERELDRVLETGWYEVPPVARRHIAKPLVRGGFDAPVHPEW